jgi:hypothetical protein
VSGGTTDVRCTMSTAAGRTPLEVVGDASGVKQRLTCDRQQLGCTSRTTASRSSSVHQVQQSGREWKSVEPDKKIPDIRVIGRARPRCSQTIVQG